jgi:hypothetical protein
LKFSRSAASVTPTSRIQVLPNTGPYQRPPSTKLSTVARRVASSEGCGIFVLLVVEIAAFANFWLQRGKGG